MLQVKPFPGIRPDPDKVEKVVSPPYDVLDSDEAREKAHSNPDSFLRIIKPEIDFDPSFDPYDYTNFSFSIHSLETDLRSM